MVFRTPSPGQYEVKVQKANSSAYATRALRKIEFKTLINREPFLLVSDPTPKQSTVKPIIERERFRMKQPEKLTQFQMMHMERQVNVNINFSQVLPRLVGGAIPRMIIKQAKQLDLVAPNYYSNVQKGSLKLSKRSSSCVK